MTSGIPTTAFFGIPVWVDTEDDHERLKVAIKPYLQYEEAIVHLRVLLDLPQHAKASDIPGAVRRLSARHVEVESKFQETLDELKKQNKELRAESDEMKHQVKALRAENVDLQRQVDGTSQFPSIKQVRPVANKSWWRRLLPWSL